MIEDEPPAGGEPPWSLVEPAVRYQELFPEARAPQTVAEVRALVSDMTRAKGDAYLPYLVSLAWLGQAAVPYYLEAYPRTTRAEGRVRLLFFSMSYGSTSAAAYQLGLTALQDRATLVRYRACMLLGRAGRKDALPALRALLKHESPRTRDDAARAIWEIEHRPRS